MKTTDFIKENKFIGDDARAMHQDHEVQMARSDCYNAAKYAIELHKLLKNISEMEGLDGWVSEKITLANDYLRTVAEYLRHEQLEKQTQMPEVFTAESAEAKFAALLNEFAPSMGGGDDGDDGFDEDTLRQLAAKWYNGDEDPAVERILMAAGWEIGQDEGYEDEPGVFVVMSGDEHGKTYMSWPAEDLRSGMAEALSGQPGFWSSPPESDIETFGLQKGRPYQINSPQDFKPGDRKRAKQQLIPTQDKKDHIRSRLGKHVAPVLPEQGMAEGAGSSDLQPGTPIMIWLGPRNMLPQPPRDDKKWWDKGVVVDEPEMMSGSWQVLVNTKRKGQSPISPERVFILKQGVSEAGAENNPVVNAITRRIIMQRTDLLSKYGLEKVSNAIDEVADFIGDVEEIGSSDVSGWIRHVEQMLGNMEPSNVAETTSAGGIATVPGVGGGPKVGSLFGGSYSPKTPFTAKKKSKSSVIKR